MQKSLHKLFERVLRKFMRDFAMVRSFSILHRFL